MKKTFILIVLFILFIFASGFSISPAIAATATPGKSLEVFEPQESKTVTLGTDSFTFKKLTDKENNNTLSVVDITHAANSKGLPLFKQHVMESPEDFYILSGNFEFFSSQPKKKVKVEAGDVVRIPAGLPYGYKPIGSSEGRVLVISQNTAFQNMLSEIGTPFTNQSSVVNVPKMEDVASVARKYGIEFLN